MSVCAQSGQTEEDNASEEVVAQATRDIYKQKPASKVVRVLTVLAYLLSVSLAAILLSVYYVCVWRSPELPLDAAGVGEMSARRDNRTPYNHVEGLAAYTSHTYGGGDTTVNGDSTNSPPENITDDVPADGATEPSTDSTFNATRTVQPTTTPKLNNGTLHYSTLDDTDNITSRPLARRHDNGTKKT